MAVGSFKLPIATSGDWTRPSDWLAMPTGITSANQTFVALHAIFPNGNNFCTLRFSTSVGQYQVDWGDGTTNLYNSNVIAYKEYNYSTYDTGNTTLSSRGYKQAIITVTPVSGNLLTCDLQLKFSASQGSYSSGFLDCILSMPNASIGQSIIFGGDSLVIHRYVERFDIKTIGNTTSLLRLFQGCVVLSSISLFDTTNVTTMERTFAGCGLNTIPLFNTINVTNMNTTFNGSLIRTIPLLNTTNVTNMANCFQGSAIRRLPLLNTANVTNMQQMFSGTLIENIPLLNTANVTTFLEFLRFNTKINSIPALSTASITTTSGTLFSNFTAGCSSLDRCEMVFAQAVTLTSCQFSQTAIVEIFTNLVDRTLTTSANINITGNFGASALTAAERLIATAKNWTITG